MSADPESLDLPELSARAGVSARTVRYYIQQGLLPSPESRGPGARYGAEHLDRLRLIKRLQREHLPLAEIRRRLEGLDPGAIRHLLRAGREPPRTSARDYIHAVLAAAPGALGPREVTAEYQAVGRRRPQERAQWDRITLAPDVELHVRRPLSREDNRKVERLLDAARLIFEEDEP